MANFLTKYLKKSDDKQIYSPTKQWVGSIFGTAFTKSEFEVAFSSISYACMKLRADAMSSLKFNVYYDYGNGEKEIVEPSHWMNKIIKRPNPTTTWRGLLKLAQYWLDYNGNAYIYAPSNGLDYPAQFYVLQSDNIKIKMGSYGPLYYEYTYGGKREEYSAHEIIHIKSLLPGSDPSDDFIGKSVVGRAIDIIRADSELNSFMKRHFANDGIPPFILKSEGPLEDGQVQQFVLKWNQKLPNHKMMGALEGGLQAMPLSSDTSSSVSVDGTNRLLMEKLSIIYGIPFQKLTGAATSIASAEVSDFSFRMDTIEPLAYQFIDSINIFLQNYDSYLYLDFEEFNFMDADTKMKLEKQDLDTGVLTINEVRADRGLEPVEWGDTPIHIQNKPIENT